MSAGAVREEAGDAGDGAATGSPGASGAGGLPGVAGAATPAAGARPSHTETSWSWVMEPVRRTNRAGPVREGTTAV